MATHVMYKFGILLQLYFLHCATSDLGMVDLFYLVNDYDIILLHMILMKNARYLASRFVARSNKYRMADHVINFI
jgi:hypothetical protein